MRISSTRFTLRRLMAIVAAAAVLLAIVHQVLRTREIRRQWAFLHSEIVVNQLAQAELKVMIAGARGRQAAPEEIKSYELSREELRRDGQALRQRISRLRP